MARRGLAPFSIDASPLALRLLDPARGRLDPPIRSEIFGPERFAQHGRSLGETHQADHSRRHTNAFFPRLSDNVRVLREAQDYIGTQARTGYDVSPAAEWLLDNFHLIEGQLQEINDGLPRRYFRDLPVLLEPPLAGLPRVYGVAWAFVAHTDGAFDEALLTRFLTAYQETRELTLGELWALPTTLRVVLVENLRRLAERVAVNKSARELANGLCDRIDTCTRDELDAIVDALQQRGAASTFFVQMAQRLRDHRPSGEFRPDEWLRQALPDVAAVQVEQPVEQAADNLSVSNAIGSLRLIGNADWQDIIAATSATMQLLLSSTAFAAEREDTRDQTLHAVERLAQESRRSESSVARILLELMDGDRGVASEAPTARASAAGHWLQGGGRPVLTGLLGIDERRLRIWRRWRRRAALPTYLGILAVATASLVGWMLVRHSAALPSADAPLWLALLTGALMLFPASEAVVAVINRLIGESAVPTRLPRLALTGGIPAEHRVMVVIPGMLTSARAVRELAQRLELHHIANPEPQAQFALLTDWADAPEERMPTDQALLDEALAAIEELNARHPVPPGEGRRFLLLHRPRSFSETEQRWIGWERKRGKLEQLVALLAAWADASASGPFSDFGESSRPRALTRYLVTLDGDTGLPPGRLRELVGIAAHPDNQPVVDPRTRSVTSGYGILQPRLATPLPSASEATRFHWLFSGQCGIDPYSAASSEVYQDVFGEGTFTGKGLIHVAAAHAVLDRRLPEGQVLSHDLLEGSLARCATVTDISLIEDAPFHADVAASRVHRWTRGDWQLLPFLCSNSATAGRGIRAINRWKMLDNLRRSLVAPMSLGLLLLALASDVVSPWAALSLVFAAFTAGPLMGAVAGFAPSRDDIAKLHFYRLAAVDLVRALCGGAWYLALLLQQALQGTDAVLRALYRMAISRRHLLQWTTAAAAQAAASTRFVDILRKHRVVPPLAVALFCGLLAIGPSSAGLAALLCLAWAGGPVWVWWVSRPRAAAQLPASLSEVDKTYLHGVARDTWRVFERCVVAADNHLPPDNIQVTPHTLVAHRTSPTNIGLYLLSTACARHFGWIGTEELLTRMEATVGTLIELPRHRGHFLNWYDTERKAALLPMYVSTVDSGNLSGHLLAVAEACRELGEHPYDEAPAQRALAASLAALEAARPHDGGDGPDGPLARLLALRDPLGHAADTAADGVDALLRAAREEIDARSPAEESPLAHTPLDRFAWHVRDHLSTLQSARADRLAARRSRAAPNSPSGPSKLPEAIEADAQLHPSTAARLASLAAVCERLAWEPDYAFLYHPKRHLFHIGFRVAEQQLDASYYDLLASESRLTSLLAIAKGDVPVSHWAALGRPFYAVRTLAGLRSWSGSMFEYLMPSLMLDEPRGSVLDDANRAALLEQIRFAAEHQVPWGVSESAYAASDHTLAYQYAPQGVARLALRRTPPDELVIAPYATALAALVAPADAVGNFRRMELLQARGQYGFVEALDFTASRQSASEGMTRVNTFMAHHQGMTIVALADVLLQGRPRRWGMANAHIRAVASLLHERAPREVPVLRAPPPSALPTLRDRRQPGLLRDVLPGSTAVSPTYLLSNGRYSVALRANGAGWSRWGSVAVTRSRDDALRDAFGSFFHLRLNGQATAVSLTQHPAPDPAAEYRSTYHADRVCFDAAWPEVQSQVTVWVSPEDDIEFRRVELRNVGDRALDFELMSAFQITLADTRADEAHPAFSNLFLRARWEARHEALIFERKPRLATEKGLHAAHFLSGTDGQVVSIGVQTDRARWLGRNRDASQPLASFDPAPDDAAGADPVPGLLDTGLDPVCALSVRVRLAPGSKLRLTFCTAVSDNGETLAALVDRYRQKGPIERASMMSATLTGIRMRELRFAAANFAAIQDLTTALVMNLTRPGMQGAAAADTDRACDRRLLWRFGISGDLPILLVTAGLADGIGLLRSLVQALRVWSWGGVACDLVVLNAEPTSYLMALNRELTALRERYLSESGAQPGPVTAGFHLLRIDEVSADEASTLRTLARLHLNADGRPLTHHLQEWNDLHEEAFAARRASPHKSVPVHPGAGHAKQRTSVGRFMPSGGEFRFEVDAFQRPKKPWVNVLANPDFGTQLSEAGGGYTWALNSRLNMITPWSNDPLADPPGEWLLLQDTRDRAIWSVTPSAWSDPQSSYRVSHGQGHSVISHRRGDVDVTVSWCVDAASSVKQARIRIVNRGHRTQRLRAIGMVEWVMGGSRGDRASADTSLFSQPLPPASLDDSAGPRRLTALLCTQRERSAGFGQGTAFFAMALPENEAPDWTCDRRECFDGRGRLAVPDDLGQASGAGLDPCGALTRRLTLAAGESAECVFLLGFAVNPAEARRLVAAAATVSPMARLEQARAAWDELLGATRVQTPDPLFDAMVNRWLLYQTLSCRLWAKAGFYQAGGAFGFRDQLQDAMALAWCAPRLLRQQILLNASRQFVEGDVQHWWHAPTGAGVRTHFSDDLLWLPYACSHYLNTTGDRSVLDEPVHFIEGGPVPEGAEDAYYAPTPSATVASLYEHAARTIDKSLNTGVHGLPLMGSGDWNDGMNRVGHEGRGESVWLAWFLCDVVQRFAPIARERGDAARAERWEEAARGWKRSLQGEAWDGQWFKRAFFDDGTPLGSQAGEECRIDLIAQSWAVISGAAPPAFQRMAMNALDSHLVDREAGLIKLLTPPLDLASPSAGYIQAYPKGVRENGGQYSHAGVWAMIAQAMSGHADQAWAYFKHLSPAHRSADPLQVDAYGIEPYVMAGDVYTEQPYVGRGGWSWYTGSAAWMHRAAVEHLFGLRQNADSIAFEPCLPPHWGRAEMTLSRGSRQLRVIFYRDGIDSGVPTGERQPGGTLARGSCLQWAELAERSVYLFALDATQPARDASLAYSN